MRLARRTFSLVMLVSVSLGVITGLPTAGAAPPPSARLFAATDLVTVERERRDRVYLDPGVWVASVGGALELRASRPDYDTPVGLLQTDAQTGEVLRTLSPDLLDGWLGLKDFVHIAVRDARGDLVLRQPTTVCPNSYSRSRISHDGPLTSRYPQFCGGNPFTRGTVFGIDAGWATSAFGSDYYGYGVSFDAPERRYEATIWIDPAWVDALAIADEDARVTVDVRVRSTRGGSGREARSSAASPYERSAAVPETTHPPADTLADLVALPAWGIGTSTSRRGRDLLTFNATEWDAGPGTLVVEGFRRPNADTMEAYQYFLRDGEPVARAPVGNLEFHPQHHHWHFQQFTQYSLLDAQTGRVAVSGKQSWCLVNTDALDLSVPNANWAAWGGDVTTMCGGPQAIWIREVLDVGWGDTYGQYLPGQAFDITDLPNGEYYVRVHVNPDGLLYETKLDNNVEDRLIRLRGRPGARRVVVPPWHGIDTEGCAYCPG